ncbi:MAG: hypothetical protein HRT66_06300 [Flavobacteriaceae bacterium]|nr:hypothetical protein [Flavobacteriaceae bacterium]
MKTMSNIASSALIFVGIGHTITDLTSPKTEAQNDFLLKMKEFTIEILGTETNIFSFHQGYSLMMGLLLFGYGLLNILISKNNKESGLPTNILVLNSIVCFASLLLSIRYFFVVPIVLTGIAFTGYTISLIKNKK